jgi:S1-C subfamily serine protease
VPARLVGRDPTTDLALLHAEAALSPPRWAGADALHVGHLVLSVGRHDRHAQASLGIVSARDEAWTTSAGGKIDAYVQSDIAVYPGFSGSALVDAQGRVTGMNSSWLIRQMSLALPLSTLRRVVDALVEHGRVRRGFLGISAYPARLSSSVASAVGRSSGLVVVSVEPDSPAEAGGMLVGDCLLAIDGEIIDRLEDLFFVLNDERVGQNVTIEILRGGSRQTLSITLGERR